MKKALLSLLFMAAAMSPANAGIFKYGVEGGLNLNKMSVGSAFDSSNKAGWFFGPKAQLTVPVLGLMVDASLQYSQTKMDVRDEAFYDDSNEPTSLKKTLPYFVVPVNLKYAVGLGSMASLYLSTGPQWNWYVGGTSLQEGMSQVEFERNTLTWNVGVGVHLLSHLQVGATYNIAMGKSFAETSNGMGDVWLHRDSWKNNGWQVRIAYMF